MPETRNITVQTWPEGTPVEDKIPENAIITYEPYEVSDEEIEAEIEMEAREIAIQRITDAEKAAIKAKRSVS